MNFPQFLGSIMQIIDYTIIPFIFSITFIVFIWGMFQYFVAGGADEEKRKEGRKLALWGIIGFAIMISVWGIVALVTTTFPLTGSRPNLPTFGPAGGGTQTQTAPRASPSGTQTTPAVDDPLALGSLGEVCVTPPRSRTDGCETNLTCGGPFRPIGTNPSGSEEYRGTCQAR